MSTEAKKNVFAERLHELFITRGVSYATLSSYVEVPTSTLYRFVNGQTTYPSVIAAIRIADYFGVSLDWLFGRTDNKFANAQEDNEADQVAHLYHYAEQSDKFAIRAILSKYDKKDVADLPDK